MSSYIATVSNIEAKDENGNPATARVLPKTGRCAPARARSRRATR